MTISARGGEFQGLMAIRCDVAFDTPGIANGLKFGVLPPDSVLIALAVNVTATFNGGTTNVLTVGTDATAIDVAGVTGISETLSSQWVVPLATFDTVREAETPLYVKYTQTGTAATTGAATIVAVFANGLSVNVPSQLST